MESSSRSEGLKLQTNIIKSYVSVNFYKKDDEYDTNRNNKKFRKSTKESLQKNVNKGTLQISNRQKEALTEAIQQMKEREKALPAYFTLKNWLYDQKKPLKIKSAMCWGGLSILKEMNVITWPEMKQLYGEFMSKIINLR